jgi:hypothetical protein
VAQGSGGQIGGFLDADTARAQISLLFVEELRRFSAVQVDVVVIHGR